jgi:A/G-specific adenine glycosylase
VAGTVTATAERVRILDWASAQRRDLPWRRTRDPWAVLVSEVMLQQTQVDRVVPRWTRFLDRWPSTAACAAASLGDVLAEWQGLGYPRRARALHASARQIDADHDGRFPDDLDALLALPGVGPYTARAVLAFAFERDVAVVDTNVGRILARRSGERLAPAAAQAVADDWVPPGQGWAWNQGLLDVGARCCRPRDPGCGDCPVAPGCAWHLAGHPDPDPATGSAAVSRPQARFEGSARQARGRLMAALSEGPLPLTAVPSAIGWSARADAAEVCAAIVDGLVADGLAERDEGGRLALPR